MNNNYYIDTYCKECNIPIKIHKNSKFILCSSCKEKLTKIVECKNCHKSFEVKFLSKRKLCKTCKEKSLKNHFSIKDKNYYCKYCGNLVFTIKKK